jgi:WXXGXW repeat (2 copies)
MHLRTIILPIAVALLAPVAIPAAQAQVAVGITVGVAPPPLPVYVQPPIPGPGYLWTPGYWLYGPAGYYWVPGVWVRPPRIGVLWTPGYWGWSGGSYLWHAGYWGPHVGFYGGIDYGFGYNGVGFFGGRWEHGAFAYNTAVWHVGPRAGFHTYHETVIRNTNVVNNRVSYNGGTGGIRATPTAAQLSEARERHLSATAAQTRHQSLAARDPRLRNSVNHGHPRVEATRRTGTVHATAAARPRTESRHPTRPGTPRTARPSAAHAAADHHAAHSPAHRKAHHEPAKQQPHTPG